MIAFSRFLSDENRLTQILLSFHTDSPVMDSNGPQTSAMDIPGNNYPSLGSDALWIIPCLNCNKIMWMIFDGTFSTSAPTHHALVSVSVYFTM